MNENCRRSEQAAKNENTSPAHLAGEVFVFKGPKEA